MTIGTSIWANSFMGIISHSRLNSSHLNDRFFINKLQGLLRDDTRPEVLEGVLAAGLEHLHHFPDIGLHRSRHLLALKLDVRIGRGDPLFLRDGFQDQAEFDALLRDWQALLPEFPGVERGCGGVFSRAV